MAAIQTPHFYLGFVEAQNRRGIVFFEGEEFGALLRVGEGTWTGWWTFNRGDLALKMGYSSHLPWVSAEAALNEMESWYVHPVIETASTAYTPPRL